MIAQNARGAFGGQILNTIRKLFWRNKFC